MGGLALKNLTRRFQKEEFEAIVPEIKNLLLNIFTKVEPTVYYKQKDSFGDVDFICLIETNNVEELNFNTLHEQINTFFKPNKIVHLENSPTCTFDYKELQVDLILTTKSDWESSLSYFSYNDLSNLIGKTAHGFGLKFGSDGLKYRMFLKPNDLYLGDIYLTKDTKTALEFLGYDHNKYTQGFDTIDNILEYAQSTKYFSKQNFLLENLSSANRARDEKRKVYNLFIDYLNTITKEDYKFFENKDAYLSKIAESFPNFYSEYNKLLDRHNIIQLNKEKFNAIIISEHFTNYSFSQIGLKLKKFKSTFSDIDEYINYIHQTNIEKILDRFESTII